jgi:TIR domain
VAEIFLSYRRQDSQSATGRLADSLGAWFGPDRVFRDHDAIVAGEDFADAIRRAIDASTVVLVVIGPRWVGAADAQGRQRLAQADDFVRIEIESALEAGVPLVPVLVEGATMPGAQQLPESLAAFTRCQAMELSELRWRYDARRLCEALHARFAIEALVEAPPTGGSGGSGGRSGWMPAATRLAIDVLDLATHPTRLILRRQTGQASDHIRAFLFLLGALSLGNFLLLLSFSVPAVAPRSALGELAHGLSLAASGVLSGVFAITLLLIVKALAWRLAGTRVEFRQLSLVFAYIAAGLWVGLCFGAFVFGQGLQLSDEGAFGRMVLNLWPARAPLPLDTPWDARIAAAEQAIAPALATGPVQVAMLLALGIWFATGCWLLVAWQGFSMSFRVSRWRALLATTIWFGLLFGAGGLIARIVDA